MIEIPADLIAEQEPRSAYEWFVAGAVSARGQFNLGASKRGSSVRFSPSITVELSDPEDVSLSPLFDGPVVRHYYGAPQYRFVMQDQQRIASFAVTYCPLLTPRKASILAALADFCRAERHDQADLYRAFHALKDGRAAPAT